MAAPAAVAADEERRDLQELEEEVAAPDIERTEYLEQVIWEQLKMLLLALAALVERRGQLMILPELVALPVGRQGLGFIFSVGTDLEVVLVA